MKVLTEFRTKSVHDINYPCLLKGRGGMVVLFAQPGRGTVVHSKGDTQLGYYSQSWDMSRFEKVDVTVTLSDEA